jgi:hypothetical protein
MATTKKVASKKPAVKVAVKKTVSKKVVRKQAPATEESDNKVLKAAIPKKAVGPKKSPIKIILSDDDIDIVEFDKLNNDHIPFEKLKRSRGSVALAISACPQGKQPKVIRDNPKMAPLIKQIIS